jgi:hypothetical protein
MELEDSEDRPGLESWPTPLPSPLGSSNHLLPGNSLRSDSRLFPQPVFGHPGDLCFAAAEQLSFGSLVPLGFRDLEALKLRQRSPCASQDSPGTLSLQRTHHTFSDEAARAASAMLGIMPSAEFTHMGHVHSQHSQHRLG